MKLVLLSGGSGKRLWPLSSNFRPKQFLEILKNENNQLESMIKRVWRQLDSLQLTDQTYFITSESHGEIIKSQLGKEVPLILEPLQRDTFPAITLAVSYLYSNQQVDVNEVVCILPVDQYVDGHFFETVMKMENILENSHSNIALIGVSPTQPSEKYGYIVPAAKMDAENGSHYYSVERFTEKPGVEEAEELIKQGALWNCGVFSFTIGYFLSLMKEKGLPASFKELVKIYDQIPKISFDYEVVEKAEKIVVVPYKGGWKDLGTWNSLTEELDNFLIGKGFISGDSENTHLINELPIPVNVLGISDAVIAASSDGILVTDKKASIRLKDFLHHIEKGSLEETEWGLCRILEYCKNPEGLEVITKRIKIFAGKTTGYQKNHNLKKIWTIISGKGECSIDGVKSIIKEGDILKIPGNSGHEIKGTTNLEIIEIQIGNPADE
ncbi:sugar phosphate nucleotidyltransferase [Metabacillus arenae]|uniref:sugar phosphate nucleotidyltransferase n=1 Tax=Metabacillus arenae TaxID=2771434 RepID=UPI001CD0598A|nr:sugar phosphate nucleotidyltransferase [Metabacillus arenae]